jgi:hypothetical protein
MIPCFSHFSNFYYILSYHFPSTGAIGLYMSEALAPAARRLFKSQSASFLLNPVLCFRHHFCLDGCYSGIVQSRLASAAPGRLSEAVCSLLRLPHSHMKWKSSRNANAHAPGLFANYSAQIDDYTLYKGLQIQSILALRAARWLV